MKRRRSKAPAPVRLFFSITLPLLKQNILVCVLLAVTGGFAGFDLFFTMTNGQPYNSTEVPATWIIKQAFDQDQLGYGIALTVILTVVVSLISLVYLRFAERANVGRILRRRAAPREWLQFGVGGVIVAGDVLSRRSGWSIRPSRSNREIFRTPFALPATWRWENLVEAWKDGGLGDALSQLDLRHRGGGEPLRASAPPLRPTPSRGWSFRDAALFYRLLLIGLLLPPPAVAIALFTQLRDMGLLNTPWALILPAPPGRWR